MFDIFLNYCQYIIFYSINELKNVLRDLTKVVISVIMIKKN